MSHSHCAGKPLFQYLGFHYIWYIACINPFANYYLVTMLSHPLTWLLFSNPFSISTAVYAVHGKEDSVPYVVLIFFIFKKPYLVTSTNNMWINDPSICLVHVQYSATQHGAAIGTVCIPRFPRPRFLPLFFFFCAWTVTSHGFTVHVLFSTVHTLFSTVHALFTY